MAASRLTKGSTESIVPYLWDAFPLPAERPASHGTSKTTEPLQEKEAQEHYQHGYRDGEAAARKAKADVAIEELAESVADLAQTRSALFRSSQADVLRLAMAVARRIIHRELLMSPDVLGGVISVALDRIEEADLHRIRVHPAFVDRIDESLSGRTNGRKVQIVADSSLPLGGCVFETQHGNVEAGIESQLSEIERGLADHLEVRR
jgi:flagellar assembly protein FliH